MLWDNISCPDISTCGDMKENGEKWTFKECVFFDPETGACKAKEAKNEKEVSAEDLMKRLDRLSRNLYRSTANALTALSGFSEQSERMAKTVKQILKEREKEKEKNDVQ